jgi:Predicted transcriptional regulators
LALTDGSGFMQKISIADIKIHKRAREEVLEIEELAESIKRFGLLNPIIVDTNYILVAGYRRLEAVKRLGWSSIDANIIEIKDGISALELEIEENIQRIQFSDEELLNAFKKLNRIKNPGLFKRILQAIIHFFKRLFISEK